MKLSEKIHGNVYADDVAQLEVTNAELLEALKKIAKEFHNPFATPQASMNTMRLIAKQAIRKAEEMMR